MRFIPLILIALAIVEIMIFMWAGQFIGFWLTVFLVLASALIGSFLVQMQGLKAWRDFQRSLMTGEGEIGITIFTGICLLFAGAFLITPGFITDGLGLLLLIPSLRVGFYKTLKSRTLRFTTKGTTPFTYSQFYSARSERKMTIIDVDGEEKS